MLTSLNKTKLATSLQSIGRFIGNTPLLPIDGISNNPRVKVYAKVEWQQKGGSIKSRAAFNIISEAIKNGKLGAGRELLDASSGNTALSYASIARSLGIPLTICLPENTSDGKKNALRALGVNLIQTSRFDRTDGSQERARELAEDFPEMYFYSDQYSNTANWRAHYYGTAQEIYLQTNQKVTHFVCGLGTTGTFTGTSKGLKAFNPNIEAVALQPAEAIHAMEGWKHLPTSKVPRIYDRELADATFEIDTWEAYAMMRRVCEEQGLLLSPSSAANLAGAFRLANQIEEGVIVTVFPDSIDRYPELIPRIF